MSPPPPPLRTVRATCTAHGSSKPGWNMYYECWSALYYSRFLVGHPPDLGFPLRCSAHPKALRIHTRFRSFVCHAQGPFTCLTSAVFRLGYMPYPAGYVFPLLFGGWPWLLETSCSHGGISLSLRLGYCFQTSLGFRFSAYVRCNRVGSLRYAGAYGMRERAEAYSLSCVAQSAVSAILLGGQPVRPVIHRFTLVLPSCFRLAQIWRMASPPL